jgi:hypothetical protein
MLKTLTGCMFSFYLDGFNRATEIWNRPTVHATHPQGPYLPWFHLHDGGPICSR